MSGSYITRERHCPWCTALVNRARQIDGQPHEAPQEGDYLLCWSCGEWSVEMAGNRIRKPTDVELQEIGEDDICRAIRLVWSRKDEINVRS